MTTDYRFYRNYRKEAIAESTLDLPGITARATDFGSAGKTVLRLTTSKHHGGHIGTFATVGIVGDDGKSFSTLLFGDYSERVAHAHTGATEKMIRAMHEDVLARLLPAIIARATLHYAKGAAENVLST